MIKTPSISRLFCLPVALAVILCIVVGFVVARHSAQEKPPSSTRDISVTDDGMAQIFASGRVEGSQPNAELRFQLSGCVAEVLVSEGQMVDEGQALLRLDDREYRQEVALAASGLRLAQAEYDRLKNGARPQERTEAESLYQAKLAELKNAETAWERIRQLRADNAIAQQEADNRHANFLTLQAEVAAAKARVDLLQAPPREDELQMAVARVEAARARLELAQIQLERTQLKSPLRGQVLEINLDAGELTGPDATGPAAIVADTSRTRVRAFVEELDAARVHVGMSAVVMADGLPGREFTGRVEQISPHMTRKQLWTDQPTERFDTKVRQIWIELEDAPELVMGLRVDVLITAEAAELVEVSLRRGAL